GLEPCPIERLRCDERSQTFGHLLGLDGFDDRLLGGRNRNLLCRPSLKPHGRSTLTVTRRFHGGIASLPTSPVLEEQSHPKNRARNHDGCVPRAHERLTSCPRTTTATFPGERSRSESWRRIRPPVKHVG